MNEGALGGRGIGPEGGSGDILYSARHGGGRTRETGCRAGRVRVQVTSRDSLHPDVMTSEKETYLVLYMYMPRASTHS